MTEMVLQNRSAIPSFHAELGEVAEALAEAAPLADMIKAGGDISWIAVRALQLRLLAETGAPHRAPDPEALLAAAREAGLLIWGVGAFAAVAQLRRAQGRSRDAKALLIELVEAPGFRPEVVESPDRPPLVRLALNLGETELAHRLVDGVSTRGRPPDDHALVTTRAQLAEAAHQRADAARLYGDAAERWREFGDVPERAYALLGQGRCLSALAAAAAEAPLTDARDLFTSMGYRPALAETETLLAKAAAKTA